MSNEAATMTFDDFNKTVPDDVAAARGDNFEPTDTIDAFEAVDTMLNAGEDDDLTGGGDDSGAGEAVVDDPANAGGDQAGAQAGDQVPDDDGAQVGKVDNIPYSRFKTKVDEAKSLRSELEASKARIRELEGAQQQTPPPSTPPPGSEEGGGQQQQQAAPPQTSAIQEIETKIKNASREYSEAVIDGDVDKAAELYEEITNLQSDLSVEKSEARAIERESKRIQESNKAAAKATVDEVIGRHEEYFADQFNIEQFRAARDWYMSNEGMSLSEALVAAEGRIFGNGKAVTPPKPEAETEGAEGEDDLENLRETVVANQKKRAVQRGAQAAAGQPPQMGTASTAVGNRSTTGRQNKSNGLTMSQKEFDTMTPRDLAIARGDIVE